MMNEWSAAEGRLPETWHWNQVFHEAKQMMPAMDPEALRILRENHAPVAVLLEAVDKKAKELVGKHDALRIYSNCTPYGTNAYVHVDDGDYTALYYPNTFWASEWEGGTCFYDRDEKGVLDARQYVSCKPNRMVLFRGNVIHRAMPVDRYCKVPRYCIAFKLQRDVNDPSYVKSFYGENNV